MAISEFEIKRCEKELEKSWKKIDLQLKFERKMTWGIASRVRASRYSKSGQVFETLVRRQIYRWLKPPMLSPRKSGKCTGCAKTESGIAILQYRRYGI